MKSRELMYEVLHQDVHDSAREHRPGMVMALADDGLERTRRTPDVEAAVVFDLLETIK
jgi:hypothetical protein